MLTPKQMHLLIQIVVLFASTLTIWAIDRKLRDARSMYADSGPEPSTIILLCVLLNVVCLPYYFYKTRESALGLLLGGFMFVVCFALMLGAGIAANMVL